MARKKEAVSVGKSVVGSVSLSLDSGGTLFRGVSSGISVSAVGNAYAIVVSVASVEDNQLPDADNGNLAAGGHSYMSLRHANMLTMYGLVSDFHAWYAGSELHVRATLHKVGPTPVEPEPTPLPAAEPAPEFVQDELAEVDSGEPDAS